jgi:uncharacterized protein YacL
MNTTKVIRFAGLLLGAFGGFQYAYFIAEQSALAPNITSVLIITCILSGALFGLFAIPYASVYPYRLITTELHETPLPQLLLGAGGLVSGLLVAALMGYFLRDLPFGMNVLFSIMLAILAGYWGAAFGVKRYSEILLLVQGDSSTRINKSILDTSVIIDGRIVELAKTGLISGVLVAPTFMLQELEHVAKSNDSLRAQRGTRGLEILEQLRTIPFLELQTIEQDFPEIPEVDHKLIQLAKVLESSILTVDYNLNKVAQLEGVQILNINELTNSLKPSFVVGEELQLTLINPGKEPNQGVGYLDDGTMVIAEGGKRLLGQKVTLVVRSVIQTAAGEIIFGSVTN